MSELHDCGKSGCKGLKYDGANLTCFRCKKQVFFECIGNNKEVLKLLFAMQSINNFSNRQNTTPLKIQTKLAALFNSESVFKFECVRCKNDGSYIEMVDKYIEEKEHAVNELEILTAKYIEMEQANNILKQKLNNLEQIQTNIDLENVTTVDVNNTEPINKYELKTKINKLYEKIKKNTEDNIITMTQDIEARIKMECDKLLNEIAKISEKNNRTKQTDKTTKTMHVTDNDKNKRTNDMQNRINNYNNNNIDIKSTDNRTNTRIKLKPPKFISNQKKGVFEVHISQFEVGTTENDIEEHIIEKTKIRNDSFTVEKLKSNKTNEYVSFKLTTLNCDIYEILMNEQLWSPYFKAREFKRASINSHKKYENTEYETRKKKDLRRSVLEKNMEKNYKYFKSPIRYGNSPLNNQRTPKKYVRERSRNLTYEFDRNIDRQPNNPYYNQPFLYYMPQMNNGQTFLAQQMMSNQNAQMMQNQQQQTIQQ